MAATTNRSKLSTKGNTGKFKVAGLLSGSKAQCIARLEKLTSPKQVGYGTQAWKEACTKLRKHIEAF